MNHRESTNTHPPLRYLIVIVASLMLSCFALSSAAAAPPTDPSATPQNPARPAIIVHPKFGGQILGYDIDQNGNQGLLSEFVALGGGANLVATEIFDQKTGAILKVIAKENHTQRDDYDTQGIFGDVGLDLYQHAGKNHFLTLNPLSSNKFTGMWTPPLKPGYQLGTTSNNQGSPDIAAYESSIDTGLTYVFRSNVANNTFGPLISLKPIIHVSEFFQPQIALDRKTNQAVLADSLGCPEPICVMSIALVNLKTGKIKKFTNNLGVGTVNGLALDPATGIACTTTLIDQGVEFYDLAKQTGFEVPIPNNGSPLQAGLDVAFDPIHKLFLIAQYSSTGSPNDPQPRVYVYDERGDLKNTVTGLQRLGFPDPVRINPHTRTGFLPVIVEPQHAFLELQSFTY